MKLKLDEAGHAVLQDGKPVYTHDDGTDSPFDAERTVTTIKNLQSEAKNNRIRYEKAEDALKTFEGIEDPTAAREAMEKLKLVNEKDLIKAGDRDKAVQEAIKATSEQFAPIVKERDQLKSELYAEKVGGAIKTSKFVSEKLAIPADIVETFFGKNFKYENGQVFAVDKHGEKIYSRERAGEVADVNEALSVLVDQYPNRDQILKSSGASGSGAQAGANGKSSPGSMRRSAFEALPAAEKAAAMASKVALVD